MPGFRSWLCFATPAPTTPAHPPHPKPPTPVSCKKILKKTNKVLLYPEEGWARSAASSYWTLSPCWWRRNACKVVEVAGTRRYATRARMMESEKGNLYIVGSFKKAVPDPDFKLWLTSSISIADRNMGYCMTGSLDRGTKKTHNYQTTHFAVIRTHHVPNKY
ncbi:uncharacterized protein [Halyomorpha halys]|uniref:uncharacterized protein n=1 Tax=Halyomorpha halys TaxID=286706 RepID=UPI0006D50A09|nr:uncharacterized protein LOC106689627 [Halyomorpha halys]XP_014290197.1 uncharacterized protein LOC106689627 [Halyomorpha halys]